MALVAPPLRFTAHATNRDGDRVPYTVQFTHGAVSGRLRLLNLRIDHIDAGVTYEEEVRDVIAVAFYPVALRSPNSAFADEYVMSVWQRDVGVAEPQLVHNFNLYSTSLANARFEELAPVREIFVTGATLRFEEPQLRAAVNDQRWARFEWLCARMLPGGFVLATPAPGDDPADQVADNLALIELGDDPADHVADDDESSSEGEDDLESLWLAELDGYNFRNDDRGDGSDDGSDDRSSDNLRENSSPWVPDDSSDIDDPDDPAADISALLESGTLTDDEKADITEKWECGICLLGLEAGSHLVSAHAVSADSGGRHRLHVFHSQCLRNWRGSGSACSHLCPTCKLPLGPRPLPAAWSATTRLSAPMALTLSSMPSMRSPYACGLDAAAASAPDEGAASAFDFRWLDMLGSTADAPRWRDLQEEILQHVRVEAGVTQEYWRERPAEMAACLATYPFLVEGMAAFPLLLLMTQECLVSRARETPFRWSRLLTVTLREGVDRRRLNPAIAAADADRLSARMGHTETWSRVSRIRLREERRTYSDGREVPYPFFVVELVQRGHGGEENIVATPRRFALKGRRKKIQLRDELVEELGLRHARVDGVLELWC